MEPYPLIQFNGAFKNIGIKLSGGADSAILHYAICDYYRDRSDVNIIALTMYTDYKPWYPTGAKKIIEAVKELTGRGVDHHHIFYAEGHTHNKDNAPYENGQEKMTDLAIEELKLDCIYSGVSKNPPIPELYEFFEKNSERFGLKYEKLVDYIDTRDVTRDQDTPRMDEVYMNVRYSQLVTRYRPFINYDKIETRKAYEYYNVLDKLYPLTYSCEIPAKPDVDRTKFSGHCGHCFYCLERWYGFGRIV